MTKPSIMPVSAQEPILLNERLWQQWLWKNRERDKAGAKRRLRFLQFLLALTFGAALIQNFWK